MAESAIMHNIRDELIAINDKCKNVEPNDDVDMCEDPNVLPQACGSINPYDIAEKQQVEYIYNVYSSNR